MRYLATLMVVVLAGCGGKAGAPRELPQVVNLKDDAVLLNKARQSVRESIAENFGIDSVVTANIGINPKVTRSGNNLWEVTGNVVCKDEKGKQFFAPWNATLFYMGKFETRNVSFGNRTYSTN